MKDRSEHRLEHDRLIGSAFLHMRGGMAYSVISWLLVGGLFCVYYGNTAHDDRSDPALQAEPGFVVLGWVLVGLAVLPSLLYLVRFCTFSRRVRAWAAVEVGADPTGRDRSRLEYRLMSRSTRGSNGPGDPFIWGSALFPPFGGVLAPLALIPLLVSSDSAQSYVDRLQLLLALLAALLVASILPVVLIGLTMLRSAFRRPARFPG